MTAVPVPEERRVVRAPAPIPVRQILPWAVFGLVIALSTWGSPQMRATPNAAIAAIRPASRPRASNALT